MYVSKVEDVLSYVVVYVGYDAKKMYDVVVRFVVWYASSRWWLLFETVVGRTWLDHCSVCVYPNAAPGDDKLSDLHGDGKFHVELVVVGLLCVYVSYSSGRCQEAPQRGKNTQVRESYVAVAVMVTVHETNWGNKTCCIHCGARIACHA